MTALRLALAAIAVLFPASALAEQAVPDCVGCHAKVTPAVVSDWKLSRHSGKSVGCDACHGADHVSASDVDKVRLPTPEVCGKCHAAQVEQYMAGKHSIAWAAMKAMPTFHMQPMALIDGMKGCGGCHKIGVKSADEIRKLGAEYGKFGNAACDSCHTRHTFAAAEAREPQACQTCHMGFDHPQWEMYSSSKHGVRHDLVARGILPKTAAAPTCQTCHMPDGEHGVKTAWGFLAVRLPMPEDKAWAADRATILQALGVLDAAGKPTPRLEVVKAANVVRLTQEEWQKERDGMVAICAQCHAPAFVQQELAKSDDMIRNADRLMAEAIRVVAALYKDGVLRKPADQAQPFPDVLRFHDTQSVIEQKLFVMFMEHRMRAFQGAFHVNPDYAFWYGWSELVRDVAEIRKEAAELRKEHRPQARRGPR